MKKLLAVMIIAGVFAACNDNSKTEESTTPTDTTMAPMPSASDTGAMKMDSSAMKDTSASKTADTTKPKM